MDEGKTGEPRHANPVINATASSRGTVRSESNQYCAAIWLNPTSPTANNRARGGSSPASAVTAIATASRHRDSALSTTAAASGSPRRSDSNTSRYACPSPATKSKYAATAAAGPILVVRARAQRRAHPVDQLVG